MFGGHVLVTPTTSLGHLATLPVLVESTDAVLLDHQVHASVQMAANQLRVKGTTVELIRHNNMERLEATVTTHGSPRGDDPAPRQTSSRIWYMADGVYSMFADFAPFDELPRCWTATSSCTSTSTTRTASAGRASTAAARRWTRWAGTRAWSRPAR